jgi:hypothetical protein
MANLPANSGAPNRDRLVSHHVRSRAQTVSSTGFDRYSKILSVVPLRSHLANHHRRMLRRKRVSLHNHRWAWFAVVPRRRNCHDVAAPHRSSNSATASIHFSASSSRDRSSAATCRATRRRTVLDRASGTIKRSSFKPRDRRRSRMAFIRSAACTIQITLDVTRYIVTRYKLMGKEDLDPRITRYGRQQVALHVNAGRKPRTFWRMKIAHFCDPARSAV